MSLDMRYLNFNKLNNGASLKSSIDDAALSDFNRKRLNFYKELDKFFKKNPELLEKIMSKYNSIKNRKMQERLIYRNILNKFKKDDDEKIKKILKEDGDGDGDQGKGKVEGKEIKGKRKEEDEDGDQGKGKVGKVGEVEGKVGAVEGKVGEVEGKVGEVEGKVGEVEGKVEEKGKGGGKTIKKRIKNVLQKGVKSKEITGGSLKEYYDNEEFFNISENKNKESNIKDIKAIKKKYDLNFELEEDKNFQEEDNPMQKFINDYYIANKDYKQKIKDIKETGIKKLEKVKEKEKDLKQNLIKAVDDFDNNPMNPLDILSIKNDDRIVFIAITFIIRYVSLLLVNWCVEIDIIKSFNQAFILFTFIYIIIFWLIVMIINVNISPELSGESSIIGKVQSVLYYFHFRINDIGRLLIHTLLILLLLLIPIIVKSENKINDDPLTYDERMKLYNTLSLFTIFMWLFTSIIATKY